MTGRHWQPFQTLQARFLLALALIGVLPLGLVGLGMAMLDRRALAEQSAQELTGLARGLAGQLEVSVDNLLSATRALAALPGIASLDPTQQEVLLKEIFQHQPQFARLSTFDRSGTRLASSHPGGAPSLPARQSFHTAVQHGHQAWEVTTVQSTGRASVLINTPIRNADRQVVGVVGAVIDLVHLSAVVGGVPVGGGGRVFVLDAAGRVLLHPEQAAVQEHRDYAWLGVPTGGRPAGPATVRYQIGEETLVAGYAPVSTVNWTVVVERPEEVILAPAQRAWHLALTGLGLSTGLALLAAVVLARMLTRPVHVLATAAQALAAGDTTVPLPPMTSHVSELRLLIGAFTAMCAAVHEREHALRQSEAEAERRRQETALLAEIAQGLSASLDLDTVLQRVVTGAQDLCRSERAFLSLRDPATAALVGRYEVGAPRAGYVGLHLPPGQGVGAQVLRTGQPWRTADYIADPRFSKVTVPGVRAGGHLAVVAVPIQIGGQVEGVLYASNPTTQPFSDRDEAILVRLAAHAAIAIQNAQLYLQAQGEITERRKAEAALVQAAAALEQRVEERTAALRHEIAERQRLERDAQRAEHFAMLGRLAAGVSHEIRNPLAAVFLHVDVLEEELQAPSPESATVIDEALAEIKTQLARLEDLVQDYLSLVRVGTIDLVLQDLGTVLQGWVPEWQHLAAARGVKLQVDRLEAVGEVTCHPGTLRRAFLNLVENACDATPPGGSIILAGHGTATQVRLCLQDTGSGIPAERLAQIFEPLYTTKPGGTGLGLYIVQEIVAAHGGHVTVESVAGQGTTFTITLPRRAPNTGWHP
jgi:signal transduction histidine kinase/HAMP domain-containing protein